MALSRQYLPSLEEELVAEYQEVDAALDDVEATATALQAEGAKGQHYLQALDGIGSQPVVATEGFAETMQRAWEAIKAWLNRLYRLWKEHVGQVQHTVTLLQLRSESTREKLRENAGRRALIGSFTYQGDVARLSSMYNPPRNVTQVLNALRSLTTHIDGYYSWAHKKALPGAEGVIRLLQSGDLPWSDTTRSQLLGALEKATPQQLARTLSFNGDGHGAMSAPLLNNQRLYITRPTGEGVAQYTGLTVRLRHSMDVHRPMGQQMTFPHFGLQTGEQLLNQTDTLLATLKDHHTTRTNRQRVAVLASMRKTLDRVMETSQALPEGSPTAKDDAHQSVRVIRTLLDWLSDPYEGLTTSSMNSVRAVLRLVRQNAA